MTELQMQDINIITEIPVAEPVMGKKKSFKNRLNLVTALLSFILYLIFTTFFIFQNILLFDNYEYDKDAGEMVLKDGKTIPKNLVFDENTMSLIIAIYFSFFIMILYVLCWRVATWDE